MAKIFRITNTHGTIPAFTALTGTVTSNATDTKVLNYSGTDDWYKIFNRPAIQVSTTPTPNPFSSTTNEIQEPHSNIWIYIPSGQYLVRVIGASTIAANTWALQLNTAVPSLIGGAINLVTNNILGWSLLNDGSASATVNGVSLPKTEGLSDLQLAPQWERAGFKAPVLVDATGTDVLATTT